MKSQILFEAVINLVLAAAFAMLLAGIAFGEASLDTGSGAVIANQLANSSIALNSSISVLQGFSIIQRQ